MVKEIRVVDNLGKTVYILKNIERENHFNLIHLSSGNYTIEIIHQNETIIKKVIIK
jgi:hypothetical protein